MGLYRHRITGSLVIACEGGYPERFLNEAANRNIALWHVTCRGEWMHCCCAPSDYKQLRSVARSASMRMRIREKHGLPFWLKPFRRRGGLAVGAVLFLLLLYSLSSRVWVIQVEGNQTLSDQAVLDVLKPLGVYEGAVFRDIDITELQLEALKQLPELTWLAVNQTGSTATVEVRERGITPPVEDTAPANMVATHDGVIVKITAVGGQAAVQVGDAVTKGSLLISGVVESKVGPLLKRAAGSVTARTRETVTITVPFSETMPKQTPTIVYQPSFFLFGLKIPLFTATIPEGEYTRNTKTCPLRAYGKPLPVGLETEELIFNETETVHRSEQEARRLAQTRLQEDETNRFANATKEQATITETRTETGWQITAEYVCVREIGCFEPLSWE